ncbi:MAG: SPFH domain-containing protein [Promethearchaeota archaeon]
MWILKSPYATEEFAQEVTQEIYKKKGWFRKRLQYVGDIKQVLRYNLSEIRSSTLRNKMQELIFTEGFECKLPNIHVRYGGIKHDPKTGRKIRIQGCLGKIIAEKIPKQLYLKNNNELAIKYILVREHERALYVKDGKIMGVLEAGRHDILSGAMDFNVIEIYYVDVGNITTRWGTSTMLTDGLGTRSATQVKLRINGSLTIRINNINNFITNIVKNESEYYEGNLENYVKDKIYEIVNSEMSKTDPISVYQDAEKVMMAVNIKANNFFKDAGIEIINLSVSSCKFDEQVELIFKKRLEKIKVDGAEVDAEVDRKLEELKKLKELGVDINSYLQKEQEIRLISAKKPKVGSIITNTTVVGEHESIDTLTDIDHKKPIICPNCGQNAGTGKFCQNCGNPLERICPNCGQNAGTGKFCQNCGTPLN